MTGYINTQYEIVDTTPTVVRLFGGDTEEQCQRHALDGSRRLQRSAPRRSVHGGLAEIAKNQYPDAATNMAPEHADGLRDDSVFHSHGRRQHHAEHAELPRRSGPTASWTLCTWGSNIPAQIVAKLTGVYGASISQGSRRRGRTSSRCIRRRFSWSVAALPGLSQRHRAATRSLPSRKDGLTRGRTGKLRDLPACHISCCPDQDKQCARCVGAIFSLPCRAGSDCSLVRSALTDVPVA